MSRVLVIGDTHFPSVHPDYCQFVLGVKKKYKCDRFVHIGDVVDHHTVSFHKKHPSSVSAVDEYNDAMHYIRKWYKLFPDMEICIGNHDERVFRLTADIGIPPFYIKGYNTIYETPNWMWDYGFTIDDVYYTHGTGTGGLTPSYNLAKARATSCVLGHHHSIAGIKWLVGPTTRFFGMDVGSGIDRNALGFSYGQFHLKKPVVSCAVVIDGKHPYLEVMDL